MSQQSLLSAGYIPLDLVYTSGGLVTRQAGGTASNVAAIMAFLGWRSALAGQVGGDYAGEEFLRDLRAAGVSTAHINVVPGMDTTRLLHNVRPDGHSFSYSCPECGVRFARSRPLTLAQAANSFETLPRPTAYFFDRANPATLWLAERYASEGVFVVFEPSVPASADAIDRAARAASVIKHSDDVSIGGLTDLGVEPVAGQIRIVTHGADGLEYRIGAGRSHHLPSLSTVSIDTAGAGDWTTAGFLYKLFSRGHPDRENVREGLKFGQALAAMACATIGSRGLMRLKPSTVLRRGTSVLVNSALHGQVRLPAPIAPREVRGACGICLSPVDGPGDVSAGGAVEALL